MVSTEDFNSLPRPHTSPCANQGVNSTTPFWVIYVEYEQVMEEKN